MHTLITIQNRSDAIQASTQNTPNVDADEIRSSSVVCVAVSINNNFAAIPQLFGDTYSELH